jgi:hypothetical protein
MSIKQRIIKILSGQLSSLTLDLKTHKGYQFFKAYSVQNLISVNERALKILSDQYIQCLVRTLELWPQNQKWSSTFHTLLVYKVWSLSSRGFSRYWVVSIFICLVWTLELRPFNLKICSSHLLSMIYKSTKFEVYQAKGSQYIEWSIYSFVQFDPLTSKSIKVNYFSRYTSLQSLKSVKQRVLKILSNQYTHMSSLTLWPFNLKINRGHQLFMMY